MMAGQLRESPNRLAIPSSSALGRWFLSLLPVLLAAVVYRSLVNAYFSSDDFLNLFYIVNKSPAEYLLRFHGGHLLLTRNAIFYLSYHLFGPYPEYFLATVLFTHLLNVFLLFRLTERLTNDAVAAAFAATLWGVCPVHTGTLGWYSVYGQVLVATILLVILNQAARAATGDAALSRRTIVTWPLLLLAASTSFGIGIGATLVAPAVLFLLLPPSRQQQRACIALCITAVVVPLLYRLILWFDEAYFGPSGEAFVAAVMFERGATASWHQLLMVGYLAGYGLSSLLFGFFASVGKFYEPATWVASATFVLAAVIAAVRGNRATLRQLLAFTLLSFGCYAIIAVGRSQFFEADKIAAGSAQARYHYVASLPFAVMLGIIAAQGCRSLGLRSGAQLRLLAGWLLVLGVSYRLAAPFIDLFPNARNETLLVLANIRRQVAAVPAGDVVYIPNQPFRAIGTLYVLNQVAFPGWAAVFCIYSPSNVLYDRRVFFVVKDPLVAAVAKKGRRTADLIVHEDQVSSE